MPALGVQGTRTVRAVPAHAVLGPVLPTFSACWSAARSATTFVHHSE